MSRLMKWGMLVAVRSTDLIYVVVVVMMFAPSTAYADGPGTTTAEFLKLGGGARQLALGGAGSATLGDQSASLSNPAVFAFSERFGAMISHDEWYQSLRLESVSIGSPLSDRIALGVMASYLHYGQIDGYDRGGIATGNVAAYSAMAGVSVAARLSEHVGIGSTIKYFGEETGDNRRSGWALDAGVHYDAGLFGFGASIANIGPDVGGTTGSEYQLPLTVRFGGRVDLVEGRLRALSDVELGDSDQSSLHQGLEWATSRLLILRAGYRRSVAREVELEGGSLTFGAGLRLGTGRLDYGYQPSNWLGDTHRVSMVWGVNP